MKILASFLLLHFVLNAVLMAVLFTKSGKESFDRSDKVLLFIFGWVIFTIALFGKDEQVEE